MYLHQSSCLNRTFLGCILVGSAECSKYNVYPTCNSNLGRMFCAYFMPKKILKFWFLGTSNNVDELERSGLQLVFLSLNLNGKDLQIQKSFPQDPNLLHAHTHNHKQTSQIQISSFCVCVCVRVRARLRLHLCRVGAFCVHMFARVFVFCSHLSTLLARRHIMRVSQSFTNLSSSFGVASFGPTIVSPFVEGPIVCSSDQSVPWQHESQVLPSRFCFRTHRDGLRYSSLPPLQPLS